MAYTRTNWVPGETPLSAENMNNIEEGIAELNSKTAVLTNQDHINFTMSFLTGSSSFNTPEGTGVWYMSNVTNGKPANATAYGMLFQMRSPYSLHPQANDAVYSQFYIDSNGKAFTRSLVNYSWTAWKEL